MTREEERSNGHFREDLLVKSGVCNGSFFVFIYPRFFEHFRGEFFNTGPLQFSLILIRFFFFFDLAQMHASSSIFMGRGQIYLPCDLAPSKI